MALELRARAARALLGSPMRAAGSALALSAGLAVLLILLPWPRELLAIPVIVAPAAVVAKLFPNETKKAVARALGHVAWLSHEVERQSVKQDIEGTLSGSLDRISRECAGSVPKAVRFEFLKSGDAIRELPDGTLIVGIAHHGDWTRNLVAAAWAYARLAMLPRARRYLDPEVSQGIDFVVAKDLLADGDAAATVRFIEDIWTPAIQDRKRLQDLTLKLERLREDFLFHPIVVSEFRDLGLRMAGKFTSEDVANETAEFVEFLHAVASREHGTPDQARLNFHGREIDVEVILVAKPGVYATKGPDPYRKAVEWSLSHGVRTVYLLYRGHHGEYAREVAQSFAGDERLRSIDHWEADKTVDHRKLAVGVFRLNVDVRLLTGIGYEPLLAVGPELPRAIVARAAHRDARPRVHY
jgi:hypothetical protein